MRRHLRDHDAGAIVDDPRHQRPQPFGEHVERLRIAADPRLEDACGLPDLDPRHALAQGAVEARIHKVEVEVELVVQPIIETGIKHAVGRAGVQAPAERNDPRVPGVCDELDFAGKPGRQLLEKLDRKDFQIGLALAAIWW